MKRQLFTYLFILTSIFYVSGQSDPNDCYCPKRISDGTMTESKPDTTFTFSNGRKIILCGSAKNIINGEIGFSDFVLLKCKDEVLLAEDLIASDTILEKSDATSNYKINFDKDTLRIIQLKYLPTGINRVYTLTNWRIESVYFEDATEVYTNELNFSIRKYTNQEISETLHEYEIAKAGNPHNLEEIANHLFISTISGDGTAKIYFEEFEAQFGQLDGGVAEEYKDLKAMLSTWMLYYFDQDIQRLDNEKTEQFAARLKPENSILSHKVIETTWNQDSIILAFYDQTYHDGYTRESHRIIATSFILNSNKRYSKFLIDTIQMQGGSPKIESVFLANADYDIKNELIIIASWVQTHYDVHGVLYYTFVYDNLLTDPQMKLDFLKDISEKLEGGCECNWSDGRVNKVKLRYCS